MPLSTRLAGAAGILIGRGYKDSGEAVAEASERIHELEAQLAAERARIDHIEAHWFDKHGADPAKDEPEGFEWAFSEKWEYTGTQSLRVAIDNEIALHRANPADAEPVGEPVITDADRAFLAKQAMPHDPNCGCYGTGVLATGVPCPNKGGAA
jgi:hypothetical protein